MNVKSQGSFETLVTQVTSYVANFQWSGKAKIYSTQNAIILASKPFVFPWPLVIYFNQQIHLLTLKPFFSQVIETLYMLFKHCSSSLKDSNFKHLSAFPFYLPKHIPFSIQASTFYILSMVDKGHQSVPYMFEDDEMQANF